jgi:hypothetical protein
MILGLVTSLSNKGTPCATFLYLIVCPLAAALGATC